MTLIIGGSGSGKSAYAEELLSHSEGKKKYYIATMQVYDAEGEKKRERHRKLRKDKGFVTVEQQTEIGTAVEKMEHGEKAALLECISNLAANEMFAGAIPETEEVVTERIIRGIEHLNRELSCLVIVSNNVFEDGKDYDAATMAYLRAMGKINEKLAEMADEVVEVVVGLPIVVKSRKIHRQKGKVRCIG